MSCDINLIFSCDMNVLWLPIMCRMVSPGAFESSRGGWRRPGWQREIGGRQPGSKGSASKVFVLRARPHAPKHARKYTQPRSPTHTYARAHVCVCLQSPPSPFSAPPRPDPTRPDPPHAHTLRPDPPCPAAVAAQCCAARADLAAAPLAGRICDLFAAPPRGARRPGCAPRSAGPRIRTVLLHNSDESRLRASP